MAERDQIGGPLRRHDARQPRDGQHVALLGAAFGDQRQRFGAPSRTDPRATAMRSVTGLAETSTIWAWPAASKWRQGLRSAHHAPPWARQGCGKDRARRGLDIRLPHQAFADQEAARAVPGQVGKIVGRCKARFRRRSCRSAGTWRASARVVSSVTSKVCRLRLLIPISGDFRRAARSSSGLVMHLDQHIHAPLPGGGFKLGGLRVRHRGHDDQDAIGIQRPGLGHLIGIVEEILAQAGQGGCVMGLRQEAVGALERGRIGQHRKAGRPTGLIGPGQCRRDRNRRGSGPWRGWPS